MIAPVGEKLLFEHTKFSATRGGGDHPYHHPPPPVSATAINSRGRHLNQALDSANDSGAEIDVSYISTLGLTLSRCVSMLTSTSELDRKT